MKKNILKISVFSMMGILLLGAADAAPTIKKLGGTVPGVNVTAQKNENLTPARTGSVRLNTSNVIKTGGVPAAAKINKRQKAKRFLFNFFIIFPLSFNIIY